MQKFMLVLFSSRFGVIRRVSVRINNDSNFAHQFLRPLLSSVFSKNICHRNGTAVETFAGEEKTTSR